jgi:hypothetical protein
LKDFEVGKYYFGVEDIQAVAEGKLVYRVFTFFFLLLEQNIACVTITITITELCILVFKCAQSNRFRHTPNKNRNRWKKMVLYVYVTIPTTKTETATQKMTSRAAAFSKDRVDEPFNLLQRTVEHKFNAAGIYVYDVDGTALTTLFNNPEK